MTLFPLLLATAFAADPIDWKAAGAETTDHLYILALPPAGLTEACAYPPTRPRARSAGRDLSLRVVRPQLPREGDGTWILDRATGGDA